jgi:hypothetical protein
MGSIEPDRVSTVESLPSGRVRRNNANPACRLSIWAHDVELAVIQRVLNIFSMNRRYRG